MSVIALPRDKWALLAGWASFAMANIYLIWIFPGDQTIPFHFVWIGTSLVFGLATWPLYAMISVIGGITVITGVILLHHFRHGYLGLGELAEVPPMATLFLVVVWYVQRRRLAMEQVARMANVERQRLETQQVFVRLGSHELRTSITVARGYVELIRAENSDNQKNEYTDIVLDELAKLDRVTARLTTLMALEIPRGLTQFVDLDALLNRLVHRWSPVAARRWRADSSVGIVLANAERMEVAMDSLIENAIKFTDDGDAIELIAYREDGHFLIEVTDTGNGIAEEDLPHIFELFRTGNNERSKTGTGLGLAIARIAIEARGGTISVQSRLGEGATFTARFPERFMPMSTKS